MLIFDYMDIEKIKPKIARLAEKYSLSLLLLFGSQVTGKTHLRSDVDLAFVSEKQLDLTEIAKMEIDFSQRLRIKNLEMVALNGAHPFLLKQITQKAVVLYEKEDSLFVKFKIYALKRFMEAKRLLDLRELSFNNFLQRT